LSNQIVRTDRNLAQTEFHLRPKYDAQTASKIGDTADEDEASSDENGNVDGNDNVIVVPSAPKPSPKKLITKTVDSKPLFPPVVITFDKDGREQKSR
jgi:hypothetical protein